MIDVTGMQVLKHITIQLLIHDLTKANHRSQNSW